jgi:hypothetical protein
MERLRLRHDTAVPKMGKGAKVKRQKTFTIPSPRCKQVFDRKAK